ncbi:O-antigen ligase family protein [Bradyrhizobium sp.]|uniref:O-antigen ligase family protein n=1 Tax=Bradyrhizobium sp. TaxID=376 RepID=UPI003C767FC1
MTTDQAPSREPAPLSAWLFPAAAIAATTTAFCKQFTPFYHFHSTIIFVVAAFVSSLLILPVWKLRPELFQKARSTAIVTLCIWACTALSYLLFARHSVPPTYLAGLVLFSGFFMLVGVAASGSPRSIAVIFVMIAIIYLIYLARYVQHFGFLFPPKSLVDQFDFPDLFGDIFGLSSDPEADRVDLYVTQYQNVGRFLALGALAATMLIGNVRRRWVLGWMLVAATFVMVLWVGGRGALLALAVSISIAVGRSRPVKTLVLIVATALLASGALLVLAKVNFYIGIPVIDRTIDEIQHPNPRLRGPILEYLFAKLKDEPYSIILGRGLGMFPVELGRPTPDWLIARPITGYPHNVILEALYEIGIGGMALFIVLIMIPIKRAWAIWASLNQDEFFVFQLYIFHLALLMVSGALAYSYDFYFVLGLTIGTLRQAAGGVSKKAVQAS